MQAQASDQTRALCLGPCWLLKCTLWNLNSGISKQQPTLASGNSDKHMLINRKVVTRIETEIKRQLKNKIANR